MRDIIIGTAGHIDHGKTTLVEFLTDKNTDTLPEEKKRGLTIDIGFSYLQLGNNRVGIIDVPGHEKFIKNMVAGTSSIDYLILTIACDDGVMPQTIEHLNIASILGVKNGIVVLTKRDLIDKERLNTLKKEVAEFLKGSFLEDSQIIEVSFKDPSSFENLKNILSQEIKNIEIDSNKNRKFRLDIDRVFSVKGFGTVVTGTSKNSAVTIGKKKKTAIYSIRYKKRVFLSQNITSMYLFNFNSSYIQSTTISSFKSCNFIIMIFNSLYNYLFHLRIKE